MDWQTLLSTLPNILHGIILTLGLVVTSLCLGCCLALLLTLCVLSKKRLLSIPVSLYIFIIRGTPLLVQFFIIYYGSGQLTWIQESILWEFFKHPFLCGMLTLSLNTAAYSSELFLGAIKAVPRGEIEACRALGMTWWLSLRRIIAPHAWRLALPAYSNEIIMLVKASSLASTITVLELMGTTQQMINHTFLTIEFYCIAGILYLLINTLFMVLFKKIENYYQINLKQ